MERIALEALGIAPDHVGRIPGTEIEITHPCAGRPVQHVLFDFDGTISLLREGWQHIMQSVCVAEICGDQPPPPAVEKLVARFIEETTGEQTILQMERLVEMVREAGYVPEEAILDAWGYKARYNEELIRPVQERLARLANGAANVSDFQVRDVKCFLELLQAAALHLYVFSGTDQDDVRNEAHALQVDHFFLEIWGALDSIEAFSKEKTIQTLLEKHQLSGEALLAIGDGPVEIRNIKAVGGTAVGVASNEVEGGWDAEKRERLLRAGADILVPDFRDAETLHRYLLG